MLMFSALKLKHSAAAQSCKAIFEVSSAQKTRLSLASSSAASRWRTVRSRQPPVLAYGRSQDQAVQSLEKESNANTKRKVVPAELHFGSPSSEGFAPAAQGTLFGAVALITGSTVGAGMLALPSVTAPVGFGPTAALLVGLWGLLTVEALLIAEVNLNVMSALQASDQSRADSSMRGEQGRVGTPPAGPSDAANNIVTLRQMAEFTLGDAGKGFTFVYLGLAYSLLVAYISKASEVVGYFAHGTLPPAAGAVGFVAALATLLFAGGTKGADKLNQALTSTLLLLFAIILASGGALVDWPHALAHSQSDWGAAPKAIPIVFLALVYHDLVPVICKFLGGDRKAVRSAIVLGSLVPLAMFLSWEAVALHLLPQALVGGGHPPHSLPDPSFLMEASFHPPAAPAAGEAFAQVKTSWEGTSQTTAAAAAGLQGGIPREALAAVEVAGRVTVDPLEVLMRRSSPLVASAVEAFSLLTVMTSSLGTTLSLSATLRTDVPPLLHQLAQRLGLEAKPEGDVEREGRTGRGGGERGAAGAAAAAASPADGASSVTAAERQVLGSLEAELVGGTQQAQQPPGRGDVPAMVLALTLVPPLLFALGRPDAFLGVLEVCGGYGMTLLFGVMPPLMAWQLRRKLLGTSPPGDPTAAARPSPAPVRLVPGGSPVLAGVLLFALMIGGGRVASDLGFPLEQLWGGVEGGGQTSQGGLYVEVGGHAGGAPRAPSLLDPLDATLL